MALLCLSPFVRYTLCVGKRRLPTPADCHRGMNLWTISTHVSWHTFSTHSIPEVVLGGMIVVQEYSALVVADEKVPLYVYKAAMFDGRVVERHAGVLGGINVQWMLNKRSTSNRICCRLGWSDMALNTRDVMCCCDS